MPRVTARSYPTLESSMGQAMLEAWGVPLVSSDVCFEDLNLRVLGGPN
ncbi:hypothetical protein CUMW_009940 [Citrus unshiu]|nr:hypothetical protein CUMW_009940 [Citrus unshiu]